MGRLFFQRRRDGHGRLIVNFSDRPFTNDSKSPRAVPLVVDGIENDDGVRLREPVDDHGGSRPVVKRTTLEEYLIRSRS